MIYLLIQLLHLFLQIMQKQVADFTYMCVTLATASKLHMHKYSGMDINNANHIHVV